MTGKGLSIIVTIVILTILAITVAVLLNTVISKLIPSTKPVHNVQLSCSAKYGEYIEINHLGGDTLYLNDVTIKTYIPYGKYAGSTYTVNKNSITINGEKKDTFTVGDVLRIPWSSAWYPGWTEPYEPKSGEEFIVEFYIGSDLVTSCRGTVS